MTEQTPRRDQRRHRRVPTSVRIFARGEGETAYSDPVKDISFGGAQVSTPQPLPEGTRFSFALQLPHHDAPLEVEGQVVWSRPGAMGIAFTRIDTTLHTFVDRLERDAARI
jgi:type IV pilus assembly protein PilZ